MKESDNFAKNSAILAETNMHILSEITFIGKRNRVLPWNEFIHDSIKGVVQITAWQTKVHQRFE